MVKIATPTLEEMIARASEPYGPEAQGQIMRAYNRAEAAHAGQKRASGEPYMVHSLAVAGILSDLNLDPATLAAGLLHDVVEDSLTTVHDLEVEFGQEVAMLVDGVTKLAQFDEVSGRRLDFETQESESLRKMFIAMGEDVRVVLIKLADRIHNMRTLNALPEDRRRRIARETLEIFAPLANRLGIWQMKWELEDLGFRYLNPERYKEIAALIHERQADRETHMDHIVQQLEQRLEEDGIQADVSGRPKHIYSIYRKMERKGLPFDQIFDVRAVRVIVDTVAQCYNTLGIVHQMWRPIPGQVDDYIAVPKDNLYRSLHTAVLADDGKTLEVQIRTQEMHRTAEYGIAAHWKYKEGGKHDRIYEQKIAWVRSQMDWRQDVTDAREFIDSLKTDVFQDRVYVFTPKGKLIDLPAGSTPIDFAYYVHTQIGDRCRGSKVNGKLVSLDYQLRTGDQVEILTTKHGGPSRDWLNPHLGYVKTQRARTKIRQWFKRQDRNENIAQGRAILDKELKQLGDTSISYETLAPLFDFEEVDDFLAAIGQGDINVQQIASKIIEVERQSQPEPELAVAPPVPRPTPSPALSVRGAAGLLTNIARCCNPLPGDEIIGYITRGHGVTIHRRDCPNVLRSREPERLIEVDWGRSEQTYPVMVKITAYDRGGLLRDIAAIVAAENVSMSSVSVSTQKSVATFFATLEISSIDQLSLVLTKIDRIPNVIEVQRQTG
jgi:GTP diphosphokinase / guanosine-3',5'-bis(diphosphate) 3'-diphosphatase